MAGMSYGHHCDGTARTNFTIPLQNEHSTTATEEQEKWLADAQNVVKQQSFYMRKALVSGQRPITPWRSWGRRDCGHLGELGRAVPDPLSVAILKSMCIALGVPKVSQGGRFAFAGLEQPAGGSQVLGPDAGGAAHLQAVPPEVLRALYPSTHVSAVMLRLLLHTFSFQSVDEIIDRGDNQSASCMLFQSPAV